MGVIDRRSIVVNFFCFSAIGSDLRQVLVRDLEDLYSRENHSWIYIRGSVHSEPRMSILQEPNLYSSGRTTDVIDVLCSMSRPSPTSVCLSYSLRFLLSTFQMLELPPSTDSI